jgi:hypothetical protein
LENSLKYILTHHSEVTSLNYSLYFSRKPGSTSNRITGKTVVLPKRTKFPQFIRNSAMNDENITFANQMCTVNSMTLPAASRIEENC